MQLQTVNIALILEYQLRLCGIIGLHILCDQSRHKALQDLEDFKTK